MSKIVIFNGSPRKNGYTSKLLAQVAEGAKSKGAEIIEFDLNNPGIRGCQGCYYCRTKDGCATQDYLQPMYKAIDEADAIVFGSPIYYYQVTGQARIWLDRTFPMIDSGFAPRHPGKKAVTIFAQGGADPSIGADAVAFITKILDTTYGWKIQDTIHCCGTSKGLEPAELEELSARAFQDGVNLVG